ncbi:MAG TPA: hypothetical protein VGF45_08650, partial [Polyangia bacterium]
MKSLKAMQAFALLAGFALLSAVGAADALRRADAGAVEKRIDALTHLQDRERSGALSKSSATCGVTAVAQDVSVSAGALASWATIGGCGAGASSGSGAGIKWIGRSVSGGLFQVQCQGNYGPL